MPTLDILARAVGDSREIAVFEGARLMEYARETGAEGSLVGAVLLGRVERVLPAIGAAFVRIGQPSNGFLPIAEQDSFAANAAALKTDAEEIVQVKKDAHGDKGAFLTCDVALAGEMLLYMPRNRHIGVSKRVTDEADRERLRSLGAALSGGNCGLIMRAAALSAQREAIESELAELTARWEEIRRKAVTAKAPATLYREPTLLTALSRDYAARYELRFACNDAINRMPAPAEGLTWEQVTDTELAARLSGLRLESQLNEALGRKVVLPGGGSLVIDEREALATIDVNTARYGGGEGETDAALQQNLAACAESARQIRLRNLSGIILIDFIDLTDDAKRDSVQRALERELERDRVRSALHGFTSLGLMEMTRRRTRETLRESLCMPCKRCGATGWERSGV